MHLLTVSLSAFGRASCDSKKPARKAPEKKKKKNGTMREMEQMANPQVQWKLETLFLFQVNAGSFGTSEKYIVTKLVTWLLLFE